MLGWWKWQVAVLENFLVLLGVLCVLGDEVLLVFGSWEDGGPSSLVDWGWSGENLLNVGSRDTPLDVSDVDGEVLLNLWRGRHL